MTETGLVQRIERLERDNRRIKRLALAALILVTALTFACAERPAPQKLTAHELDIVDNRGDVRIKLVARSGVAGVGLYDAHGTGRASMAVDKDGSPWIVLYDAQGELRASTDVDKGGSPEIQLEDAQGYSMLLGSTSTTTERTGQVQHTSAASIVLSDKDHHVIWQAP